VPPETPSSRPLSWWKEVLSDAIHANMQRRACQKNAHNHRASLVYQPKNTDRHRTSLEFASRNQSRTASHCVNNRRTIPLSRC